MANLAEVERLTTELVSSANQFLDNVRLLNVGAVQDEALTTTQKANIKNRAKIALDRIKAKVDAIKAEITV